MSKTKKAIISHTTATNGITIIYCNGVKCATAEKRAMGYLLEEQGVAGSGYHKSIAECKDWCARGAALNAIMGQPYPMPALTFAEKEAKVGQFMAIIGSALCNDAAIA